ncbi:hypothetical protein B5K08_26290 [Rhizobium leguminosarum bv. trifolii]|uniref:HTH arsR-type domain-containing protein n=1 Tax=Rhizobium leguminosarum bv. trifolii TaxID=386 RepID=A0A3E1B5A0_RHILT|nr:hypothetical protein B5K08_26290 [Rhizobium leguminosarum bv. trifolii]RFB86111.1 hypothetical protein B5K10_25005 [Rhizobium leguminosarum bv. trifolii]
MTVFAALSQETRLQIVRVLVVAGPMGMAAGALAEKLDVSPTNISFHLRELEHSGLITAQRQSRSIIYAASYDALGGLIRFLMEDCCSGRPEICAPMADVAACCGRGRLMSPFERYLTVWVFLCIVVGIALGHLVPGVFHAVAGAQVAKVNLPTMA